MNFIINETKQKLRGGYYTPLDLAEFLVRWVKEIKPKKILEPSCGDGVFFEALKKVGGSSKINLVGIEFDKGEATKAKKLVQNDFSQAVIKNIDFLGWSLKELKTNQTGFDAIVGNPPFIRYQYLPTIFQENSEEIFKVLNLPFTKHTNAWVPFILASMALLKPGGRLAMVIPAEIIHVLHAQSLRSYLGKECRKIVIVDPQELWFDDTLQGTVLLLAEKLHNPSDKPKGVGIYPVKDREFLKLNPKDIFAAPKSINGRTIKGKWTYALLDPQIRTLIDDLTHHPDVHQFKDVADVDVGIVTGANNFFLVPDKTVKEFGLRKWAYPMFGRSNHCPGIIYDKNQHETNKESGKPTNFIWFPDEAITINASAQQYIEYGEKQNLHTRYKCSVRTPWYSVPSVYTTKVGMLKRSHNTPRLIFNEVGAFTTDTAYRIGTRAGITSEQLVGSFMNSLTALSAELEGRHYGGGVLELTPSEIEKLLIPLPKNVIIDLIELDNAVRNLPAEEVLERQDGKILTALGLTTEKQNQLLKAWNKLRNRRQRIDNLSIN
ncbi:MAG: N-6 DNA methylase [Candidatus Wildermuthbacteria bacterium]|nr:N-6 DNA methylase [Candidatus Wildermuthbacteria bacterium]